MEAKHAEVKDNEDPTIRAIRGLAILITYQPIEKGREDKTKIPHFIMSKYYVSKTEVTYIEGKLDCIETILTKPSDKAAATEGARRFRALGTESVHVVKHVKKRYNKLLREQNKRRKENPLTVADIARMTAQAKEEEEND